MTSHVVRPEPGPPARAVCTCGWQVQRMAAAIRADRAAGEWTWDESIGLGRAAVRLEGAAADLEIVAGLLAERNSRKETL